MLKKKLSVSQAKNNVVFTGSISLSELRQLYFHADVFVLPSLKENMPQALLEAMASGKPVISSSIPSSREVLSNGESILISPSDHAALASATIKILKNPVFGNMLGQKARLHAYHAYRWQMIAKRAVDLFSELIKTNQRIDCNEKHA